MIQPSSVPLYPFKGCDYSGHITAEGYKSDSNSAIPCFGGRSIYANKQELTITTLLKSKEAVVDFKEWFVNRIDNGISLFAVYTEHLGKLGWWVCEYKEKRFSISVKGSSRIITSSFYVLGEAMVTKDIGIEECYIECEDETIMTNESLCDLYIEVETDGVATSINYF